ncbi:MAG: hypothetical protein OHK0012_23860 [Synechococcales cyanobacterium]
MKSPSTNRTLLTLLALLGGGLCSTWDPVWGQTPSPVPQPRPVSQSIVLEGLTLLPDPDLATVLEDQFTQRLGSVNAQISDRQAVLQQLLGRWESDDGQIRRLQARLSQLRTERDRMALEHLLMMRQLQEKFVIPPVSRSPSPAPENSPTQ